MRLELLYRPGAAQSLIRESTFRNRDSNPQCQFAYGVRVKLWSSQGPTPELNRIRAMLSSFPPVVPTAISPSNKHLDRYPGNHQNRHMPINPIRTARASENKSQKELASIIGVSRPFVTRAEQGCYETPGTPLTHYCAKVLGVSPAKVHEMYFAFQRAQRRLTMENKFDIKPLTAPPGAAETSNRPKCLTFNHELFKDWREQYWNTVTSFCIDMCIHPYSASHYESGDMYSMPEQIKSVMTECELLDRSFDPSVRWFYAYVE